MDKILKAKLSRYLNVMNERFRSIYSNKLKIQDEAYSILNKESEETILQLFYYIHFGSHIQDKSEFLKNVSIQLINNYKQNFNNQQIFNFLIKYSSLVDNNTFDILSMNLLENQNQDPIILKKNMKLFTICKKYHLLNNSILHKIFQESTMDIFSYKCFKMLVHNKIINDIRMVKNFQTNKMDPNPSQTQNKLSRSLKRMNIKFKEEVEISNYLCDVILTDYNIIIEYLGPIHFYPLQTQLTEQDKFRLEYLQIFSNYKLVYIPFFEWERLENDSKVDEFLLTRINNPESKEKFYKQNFNFFNF